MAETSGNPNAGGLPGSGPAAGSRGRGEADAPLPAVVVAGPTASGKSALGLALAEAFHGTVINADALQVYCDLAVLTARPGPEATRRVPHRLYGVLSAEERCSAGRWRAMALEAMSEASAAGRLPILVGGTGLYLKALLEGIAPVPPVPAAVRQEAARRWEWLGPAGFRAELLARDPASAALHPNDRQRQLRAWEVIEATGRPLTDWQRSQAPADGTFGVGRYHFLRLVLLPEREALAAAIDARFAAMAEGGALAEVEALLARGLDPSLPAMKAVGVPELAAHLSGETSLDQAVAAGQAATRRYAKRQLTWLRGQMLRDQELGDELGQKTTQLVIRSQFSESCFGEIFSNVRRFLLTAVQQEA